jgi:hypothetical protein
MTFDPHTLTVADLDRKAHQEGQVGRTAAGVVGEAWQAPWNQATHVRGIDGKLRTNAELIRRENAQIPGMVAELFRDLPPVLRRTPRQRYESLVAQLAEFAHASIRTTGQIHWPASIERELKVLGWKDGDPRLESIGTLEGAKRQIEDLARKFTPEYANKLKEKDQKKVTLDHSGHYSA